MKTPPKPAVWFPTLQAGTGTDVFTIRMAKKLNEAGIRAEICWLPLRAEYVPWSVNIPRTPKWANIVHINSWLHPRFVPKTLPCVVTVHHSIHDPALRPYKSHAQSLYHRYWIHRIEKINYTHAARIIAVSQYVATQIDDCSIKNKTSVIPNGIDCNRFFVPSNEREPNDPFQLLYVGNWSTRKGVDLLGPIMESLGNTFTLKYTATSNNTIPNAALPDNTECIGRLDQPQISFFYQSSDALLFPTRSEGLPLTAIEAMASGLPVISSNVSSLPEVVEHGVTGYLCQSDNVEAFAQAAKYLHEDSELWQRMRQAARKTAVEKFSEEKMIQTYISHYEDIIL